MYHKCKLRPVTVRVLRPAHRKWLHNASSAWFYVTFVQNMKYVLRCNLWNTTLIRHLIRLIIQLRKYYSGDVNGVWWRHIYKKCSFVGLNFFFFFKSSHYQQHNIRRYEKPSYRPMLLCNSYLQASITTGKHTHNYSSRFQDVNSRCCQVSISHGKRRITISKLKIEGE